MSKNSNNKTLKKKTKDKLIEMINDLENEVTRLKEYIEYLEEELKREVNNNL